MGKKIFEKPQSVQDYVDIILKIVFGVLVIVYFVFFFISLGNCNNGSPSDFDLAVFLFSGAGNPNPWIRSLSLAFFILSVSFVVRLVLKFIAKFLKKGRAVLNLVASLIKYASVLLLIFLILNAFNVDTVTLLVSAGVISLVIGLGAQSLISDVIAGLFIVFEEVFDIGDIILQSNFDIVRKTLENGGIVRGIRIPGGAKYSRKDIDDITKLAVSFGAKALANIIYQEDGTAKSPVLKFVTEEQAKAIVILQLYRLTNTDIVTLEERSKTLHLDEELHKRVMGQDDAVKLVSEAIIRSKAGIKDPTKPIGSFLFLGPTGVGKTELAKTLAQALFDDENAMVRLDMSEYMEKFSVSRLIGAPPGYVGYDEGGQLTEAVRRKPYSVVLFDEVEKAHPDVFNVLLQVLDDGRITDSQGRTVDFKNTIIIMTSNLGSQYLLEGIDEATGEITQATNDLVMNELRSSFRPEFLNRLDEIIMFKPLTKNNIGGIVDLILEELNNRLSDRQLRIQLTPEAKQFVIEQGYDPVYGARPLRRYIQKNVETMAAKIILGGDIGEGSTIIIDSDGSKLSAR